MRRIVRHPSMWLPVAMSLAVGTMVVTVWARGTDRRPDEGATAHVFQIWVVLEALAITWSALRWFPADRKTAALIVAVQLGVAVAVCVPVALLGW